MEEDVSSFNILKLLANRIEKLEEKVDELEQTKCVSFLLEKIEELENRILVLESQGSYWFATKLRKENGDVDGDKWTPTKGPLSAGSADRSPRGRKGSLTVYSEEREDCVNGKNIKVVEVTGEKSAQSLDMTKQRKITRNKSVEKAELNVPCRDLGKADHEGWLSKKAGGHGLVPIMWKRYWCVIKDSKLYLYKTSFDSAADYLIQVKEYTIENITEKKKIAFCMKPLADDVKAIIFAGNTDEEVKKWMEILNKILSGIDVSQKDDLNVPDYEERKRVFSSTTSDPPKSGKRHSAFQKETETTGMPSSFGARSASMTQGRTRYGSGSGKAETVLAVGSLFKSFEETEDNSSTPQKGGTDDDLLYKEIPTDVSDKAEGKPSNELDTLLKEVEQLKAGTYHLQNQDKSEAKVNVEVETSTETSPKEQDSQEDNSTVSSVDNDSTKLPSYEEALGLEKNSSLASPPDIEISDEKGVSVVISTAGEHTDLATTQEPSTTEEDFVTQEPTTVEGELVTQEEPSTAEAELETQERSTAVEEIETQEPSTAEAELETQEPSTVEAELVTQEPSTADEDLDTSVTKHVPLPTIEIFYTGERADENLTEGDLTNALPTASPVTQEANVSEVLETGEVKVELNASVVECQDDSAKVDEGNATNAPLDTISLDDHSREGEVGEVGVTSEESVEESPADLTVDARVSSTEARDLVSNEDASQPDVSISEDGPETVTIDSTVNDEVAVSAATCESVSSTLPDLETREETPESTDGEISVPKTECSEIEVVHNECVAEGEAGGHIAVSGAECSESVAPSEDTPDDVLKGYCNIDVIEVSEHEFEISISTSTDGDSQGDEKSENTVRHSLRSCFADSGNLAGSAVAIEDEVVVVTSDDLPTEEVPSTSPEGTATNGDVVIENDKNGTEPRSTTCVDTTAADDSVGEDDAVFSTPSKTDEESMLDAILNVSIHTISKPGESLLDAVMKVSRDNSEGSSSSAPEVESTEIEKSPTVHSSEIEVEAKLNGNVVHDKTTNDVIVNGCNGNASEMEVNENTCNGSASISIETTLSPDECSKSINNSVIEYI